MTKLKTQPAAGEAQLTERLRRHVQVLAGEIGNRNLYAAANLAEAARYVEGHLMQAGYTVESQPYQAEGQTVRNLIVTKPGTDPSLDPLLIGAHYDTAGNPGADDNASGTAALLELARWAGEHAFARTLTFVAFTNEEPPFFQTELMGSRVYARAAKARGKRIRAALILESIGYYTDAPNSQRYPPFYGLFYPNRGNFLGVVSNLRYRRLAGEVARAFKRRSRLPIESVAAPDFIPGVTWSDHWSFWKEGYQAVMLTDTAFLRNPNYHMDSDTPDTLDYAKLAAVVEGLRGVMEEFAH
ncbi:MAG: M28 family peptidase [Candidatus Omnitrophica bacterium]|nr:M28 family peptidase [Candidatus Omnitrophota bacterium]